MFTSVSLALPLGLSLLTAVGLGLTMPTAWLADYWPMSLVPLCLLSLQLVQLAHAVLMDTDDTWRWYFAFVPMLVGGRRYAEDDAGWLSGHVWLGAYERREVYGDGLSDTVASEVRRHGFITVFEHRFI